VANGGVGSSAASGELPDSIDVLGAPYAKGLEFGAVVVVEPEDIVAADERGHRMLFMAHTRTTRYLDIVCVGEPLPVSVPVPGRVPSPRTLPDPTVDDATLDRLAGEVAALVTGGAPAP